MKTVVLFSSLPSSPKTILSPKEIDCLLSYLFKVNMFKTLFFISIKKIYMLIFFCFLLFTLPKSFQWFIGKISCISLKFRNKINEKNYEFGKVKNLKTVILPSKVCCLMRLIFFCILTCQKLLLYKKLMQSI